MEGPGVAIGRIGGGGLLSLGIACWLARKTPTARLALGSLGPTSFTTYSLASRWPGKCRARRWIAAALGASVLHGHSGRAVLGALARSGRELPCQVDSSKLELPRRLAALVPPPRFYRHRCFGAPVRTTV